MSLSISRLSRKEHNRNEQRVHSGLAELDLLIRIINSVSVGLFVAKELK